MDKTRYENMITSIRKSSSFNHHSERYELEVVASTHSLDIVHLYIPEENRGQGLGSSLIGGVERAAKELGYDHVTVDIGATNASVDAEQDEIVEDPSYQLLLSEGFRGIGIERGEERVYISGVKSV